MGQAAPRTVCHATDPDAGLQAEERDSPGFRVLEGQHDSPLRGLERDDRRPRLAQARPRRDLAPFRVQLVPARTTGAQPELAFRERQPEGGPRRGGVGIEPGERVQGGLARIVAQGVGFDSSLIAGRPDERARRRRGSPGPAGNLHLLEGPNLASLVLEHQHPPPAVRGTVVLDDDEEPADPDRGARDRALLVAEVLHTQTGQGVACQDEEAVPLADDVKEPALLITGGCPREGKTEVDGGLALARLERR